MKISTDFRHIWRDRCNVGNLILYSSTIVLSCWSLLWYSNETGQYKCYTDAYCASGLDSKDLLPLVVLAVLWTTSGFTVSKYNSSELKTVAKTKQSHSFCTVEKRNHCGERMLLLNIHTVNSLHYVSAKRNVSKVENGEKCNRLYDLYGLKEKSINQEIVWHSIFLLTDGVANHTGRMARYSAHEVSKVPGAVNLALHI